MDDTTTCPASDLTSNAVNPRNDHAAPMSDEPVAPRHQRILDYLSESLAKANPLEANLGAVNSDLMLMAYRMSQALDEAMQQGPGDVDDLEHLMPAVDNFLKVAKQLDRFSQLAIKLKETNAGARSKTVSAMNDFANRSRSEDS